MEREGRGVWKVAHLCSVNKGLPTGENALSQIVSEYCIHMRIEAIFQNNTNSLNNVIPSLNSAEQDKPTGSTL